jgi:hypothetical protein
MVQDEAQRLRIDTVRGLIRVLLQRLETTIMESAPATIRSGRSTRASDDSPQVAPGNLAGHIRNRS